MYLCTNAAGETVYFARYGVNYQQTAIAQTPRLQKHTGQEPCWLHQGASSLYYQTDLVYSKAVHNTMAWQLFQVLADLARPLPLNYTYIRSSLNGVCGIHGVKYVFTPGMEEVKCTCSSGKFETLSHACNIWSLT